MYVNLFHRNHVYVEARNDLLTKYTDGKTGDIGMFTNQDFNLFTSDKGLKKTNSGLTKRKHNMKFFVTASERLSFKGSDKMQAEMLKGAGDRITVRYSNNVTIPYNYVPMTSWIMVHRIAHAIQSGSADRNLEYNLFYGLQQLLMSMDLLPHSKPMKGGLGLTDHDLSIFLNCALTMRSARKGLLDNKLDYLAELMAQYQHGGIKLQRSSEWAPRLASFDLTTGYAIRSIHSDATRWMKSFGTLTKQYDNFDDRIQEVEAYLNNEMGKIFDSLMGETLSF